MNKEKKVNIFKLKRALGRGVGCVLRFLETVEEMTATTKRKTTLRGFAAAPRSSNSGFAFWKLGKALVVNVMARGKR